MADISTRRIEAETRLAELRQMQGIALLDDTEFDHSPLNAVENELAALDAAEGEAVRRQREQAAAAEQERLANLRQTLAIVEEHRLEAVDRAEKAARDLTDALKEVRARSADATRLLRALGVHPAVQLDTYESEFRMSLRFATALKPLVGLRRRYGQIAFPEARTPFDQPWRAAEAAIANPDIDKALKGSF
ncbi:hypothetical protein [Mesorhizobium sp.]|uniref:hypothetical protein n=1 Tax=Mesorhizobium sp. TaxID=1871066 RepID=UPI0012226ACA|nr:hypothetical protein [Mesorhizobium sp.]TIO26937.1 MAG: hypothetical protein E5X83_06355 [Mesorhizobium sp.]